MNRKAAISSFAVVVVALAGWIVIGGAADGDRDWPAYAGDKASTKYSPLDQINADNDQEPADRVAAIGRARGAARAVSRRAGAGQLPAHAAHGRRPALHELGVGAVIALDPATGKTVWFDTLPPRPDGQGPARGGATRSLAYWTDGTDARIVTNVGINLVALNAKTGKRYADFGDNGQVDLTKGFERPITGWRWSSGPLVVKDVIVVAGVPAPATDILNERAARAEGDAARRHPRLRRAHRQAPVDVPRRAAQGRVRQRHVAERLVDLLRQQRRLVADERATRSSATSTCRSKNATGDYYGGTRPGNNLFAESIVCLDAKTGKRVWHFQIVHHGLWDYDLPAAPVLADITVNGRRIKALAQVTKQAFVYVLDRDDRPAGVADRGAPGAAGQRARRVVFADAADSRPSRRAFDQQGVTENDLIDFTPELKAEALKIVSEYKYGTALHAAGRCSATPTARRALLLMPGTNGGADWGGAAFDKETGILYVPSAHLPTSSRSASRSTPSRRCRFVKQTTPRPFGPQGLPDPFKPPYSRLVAIDLNKGDILWSVANGDGLRNHPAFKGLNLPPLGTPGRLAALVTKTLRVHGRRAATPASACRPGGGGKMFRAFDKKTGAIAWEMELPAGTSNAPMTYMVNGKQYIVVGVSGRQFPGELVALALP